MAIPFITQLPEAPQRSDARPDFALRADVFFAAIDPMRYQMNQLAAWMNDQRDDIYSYSDNVEAWMNATLDARNAAQSAATNAAASESAAKDHLDDTAALIAGFTPTGDPLPEVTSVNAPLVVATPQGGVKFSRRALNNGAGVRPALRFDFVNQGYLDPRITFTRATPDWDWNGKRYEVNEPVLSDEGLWLWGSRTNLYRNSLTDQSITVTAQQYTISFYGEGSIVLSGAHTHTVVSSGERTTYTFTPTAGQLNISPSGVEKVQLETGGVVTPYIPTEGSQVTVAASDLAVQGGDLNMNSGGGAIVKYSALKKPTESGFVYRLGAAGQSSNYIGIDYTTSTAHANHSYYRSDGDYYITNVITSPIVVGAVRVCGFSWSGSKVIDAINGETRVAEFSHVPPVNSDLALGRFGAIPSGARAGSLSFLIKSLAIFDTSLTAEQLQELTL